MRPHNLPLVMLGAGLLWFGWFGFNAGSALGANGTAAVAWVNTTTRHRRGDARLAGHGEDPRRPRHLARRGLRRRRRPGRHHPGLWPRSARSARSSSASSPACSAPCRRPEVQVRLRRLARRRRRPPRRRPRRHPHRLPGAGVGAGRRRRPVLRRRLRPAVAARPSVALRGPGLSPSSLTLHHRHWSLHKAIGLPDHRGRRGRRHRPARARRDARTTSVPRWRRAARAAALGSDRRRVALGPRTAEGEPRHEARHRDHQAAQARRGEGGARGLRGHRA